jgi:hypothetical protein
MRVPNLITIVLLLVGTAVLAQTQRTSRTNKRIHNRVDSVSTWGITRDTAKSVKDSLHKIR